MRSDRISNNDPSALRILLVEDDASQRWLTARYLTEKAGLTVILAATGLEALERARSDRPDVILLDLVLPGMDGMEVLRRYRAEGCPAPVIVISRAYDEAIISQAFDLGAKYFMPKPVNLSQLLPHILALGSNRDRQYEALLLRLGAPPQCLGLRQAARCAALLSRDPNGLLKSAYLQAARELGASPKQLDINIRRLVADLHAVPSPLYRQLVPIGSPRPSNKKFLRLLIQAVTFPL